MLTEAAEARMYELCPNLTDFHHHVREFGEETLADYIRSEIQRQQDNADAKLRPPPVPIEGDPFSIRAEGSEREVRLWLASWSVPRELMIKSLGWDSEEYGYKWPTAS